MTQKETFTGKILSNAAHIPGDYVRGMIQMGDGGGIEGFVSGEIYAGAVSIGGGVVGLLGSVGLAGIGAIPTFQYLPAVGFVGGAGFTEVGMGVLAVIGGNVLRRRS